MQRALSAGAVIRDEIQTDMTGRRVASIFDPFGHIWALVQRKAKEVSLAAGMCEARARSRPVGPLAVASEGVQALHDAIGGAEARDGGLCDEDHGDCARRRHRARISRRG
ncbi:hypothetical protein DSM21852_26960 [Methylocystis bryophila]|nr:hypothetical protein DSM21852_26960 [Methylocystis bryophila]